jgi:hypothetical protein
MKITITLWIRTQLTEDGVKDIVREACSELQGNLADVGISVTEGEWTVEHRATGSIPLDRFKRRKPA